MDRRAEDKAVSSLRLFQCPVHCIIKDTAVIPLLLADTAVDAGGLQFSHMEDLGLNTEAFQRIGCFL